MLFKVKHIGQDYCKVENEKGEEWELPLIVAEIALPENKLELDGGKISIRGLREFLKNFD